MMQHRAGIDDHTPVLPGAPLAPALTVDPVHVLHSEPLLARPKDVRPPTRAPRVDRRPGAAVDGRRGVAYGVAMLTLAILYVCAEPLARAMQGSM